MVEGTEENENFDPAPAELSEVEGTDEAADAEELSDAGDDEVEADGIDGGSGEDVDEAVAAPTEAESEEARKAGIRKQMHTNNARKHCR